MKQLILASASPRRKQLLEEIGLEFKVVPSDYEEDMTLKMSPQKLAEFLSLGKAKDVAKKYQGKDVVILAADTFMVYKKEYLGKPKSKAESFKTLSKLNGKSHLAVTGFTIINPKNNKIVTKSDEAKIYFRQLTNCQIRSYIEAENTLDKAGGYAIRGVGIALVKKVEGDYNNALGLPFGVILDELNKFGIKAL